MNLHLSMKKITLFSFFIMLTAAAMAQVKHAVTQSTINFQIKNLGFNTHGTISGLQGDIQFDPAKPESSTIEATVGNLPGVKSVSVKLSPFWISTAPKAGKITVVQQQVKNGGG